MSRENLECSSLTEPSTIWNDDHERKIAAFQGADSRGDGSWRLRVAIPIDGRAASSRSTPGNW